MATVEWVEVQGPTVDKAVEAALEELGLSSAEEADVEVIQEGQRGFLGIGGEDAVVRVKKRESGQRRRRGGRSRGNGGSGGSRSGGGRTEGGSSRTEAGGSRTEGSGGGNGGGRPSGGQGRSRSDRPREESKARQSQGNQRSGASRRPRKPREDDDRIDIPVEEQAADIDRFLSGLLKAYGLEGEVSTRIEDDIIYADVSGEQTEALVGAKGSIVQSTLELCRTIVQRKTHSGAKIRLDIAGYAERRREALRIYAGRLAQRVIDEGGEIMLEPMNSADRKVVHDSVAEIDGVRSFSEGEEPHRSVVIATDE